MKRMLALLLSAVMVLSLAACGGKTDGNSTPDDSSNPPASDPASGGALTDGIYEETTIGMPTFYRFNEDGTYYALFFNGGVTEAGTYEVVDKETEYREEGPDDTAAKTLKSSQTIITTSYQGVVTEIAYENDTLQDCNLGGMAGYRFMHHNAEYAYDPAVDEQPIILYTFYADNLSGNTLVMYHNKTYVDYTGAIGAEGTWEKVSDSEFTLTDDAGLATTLTIDGHNATYGDKALADAIIEEGAATVINTYRVDETEVGLPMPVALRIDCYSDTTCKLIVEVAAVGTEMEADAGTYELDDLMYLPTFHFAKLGDITSEGDFDNATVDGLPANIAVKGSVEVTDDAGAVTPMNLDAVLSGVATANAVPTSLPGAGTAAVVNTFKADGVEGTGLPMPVDLRVECYSDGTCAFLMYVAFTDQDLPLDGGTYTVDEAYGFHFQFATAGEVTGEPDYANATETNLDINVNYKADITLDDGAGNVTPLSIDSVLTGPAIAG